MSPHDFADDAPWCSPAVPGTPEEAPEDAEDARAEARLALAVRAALAPEQAHLSQDAAQAFASVHSRLMEAIDFSRQEPGLSAPEAQENLNAAPETSASVPSAAPVSAASASGASAPAAWVRRAPGHAWAARSNSRRGNPARRLQGFARGRRLSAALAPSRASGRCVQVLGDVWGPRVNAAARYAAAACVLALGVVGGHKVGRQSGPTALPVQSLMEDYASGLGPNAPLEVSARSEDDTSRWLSQQMGRRVSLPAASRVGAMLLGARRCIVEGRPSAQAHYLKNGVRVTYYQIHAPHLGLSGLGEIRSGGRSYFTQKLNGCNLIVWRSDEDIMAVVSPLEMPASLSLAHSMRDSTPVLSAMETSAPSKMDSDG